MMNLQMLMSLRQALQNRLQHMPPGPTVQPVGRPQAHRMGMAPAAVAQAAMPGGLGSSPGLQLNPRVPMGAPPPGGMWTALGGGMPGVNPPVTPGVGMPALTIPQTIGEARTQPRLGSLLSGM